MNQSINIHYYNITKQTTADAAAIVFGHITDDSSEGQPTGMKIFENLHLHAKVDVFILATKDVGPCTHGQAHHKIH